MSRVWGELGHLDWQHGGWSFGMGTLQGKLRLVPYIKVTHYGMVR